MEHRYGTSLRNIGTDHWYGTLVQNIGTEHLYRTSVRNIGTEHRYGTSVQNIGTEHRYGTLHWYGISVWNRIFLANKSLATVHQQELFNIPYGDAGVSQDGLPTVQLKLKGAFLACNQIYWQALHCMQSMKYDIQDKTYYLLSTFEKCMPS